MKKKVKKLFEVNYSKKQVNVLKNIPCSLEKNTKISKRKEILGSGLVSLGNLFTAGLFFGQAFGGLSFDILRATIGLSSTFIFYLAAYKLMEE